MSGGSQMLGRQKRNHGGHPGAFVDTSLRRPTAVGPLRGEDPLDAPLRGLHPFRCQHRQDCIGRRLRPRPPSDVRPASIPVLLADKKFNRHKESQAGGQTGHCAISSHQPRYSRALLNRPPFAPAGKQHDQSHARSQPDRSLNCDFHSCLLVGAVIGSLRLCGQEASPALRVEGARTISRICGHGVSFAFWSCAARMKTNSAPPAKQPYQHLEPLCS